MISNNRKSSALNNMPDAPLLVLASEVEVQPLGYRTPFSAEFALEVVTAGELRELLRLGHVGRIAVGWYRLVDLREIRRRLRREQR